MLTLNQHRMLKKLQQEKYSYAGVAKKMGIDWRTVKKHANNPGISKYEREKPYLSKLDKYKKYIINRLGRYPGLTAEKIYREIKGQGFDGAYRIVAEYVSTQKKEFGIKEPQSFLRIETPPGKEAQCDWGEFGLIKFKNGEIKKIHLFALILSYSRMKYAEFTTDEQLLTLEKCHQNSFEYFGGVPDKVLYDNMKTVVIKRQGRQIEYNQHFMELANYYGFIPKAHPPRKPNQKGKVERMIGFVRTSFFEGEEFEDLDNLNHKFKKWLQEIGNKKINQTTRVPPIKRFKEEEESTLNRLPGQRMAICLTEIRKVQKDCYFNYKGNLYSVPHEFVGSTVLVKDYGSEIIILNNKGIQEICRYQLEFFKKGLFIKNKNHFQGLIRKRRRKTDWKEKFTEIGAEGEKFYAGLKEKYPNNIGYHSPLILNLQEDYSLEELIAALKKANNYKAFAAKYVRNIILELSSRELNKPLSTKLDTITADPLTSHIEVQLRPLSVYDQFLE